MASCLPVVYICSSVPCIKVAVPAFSRRSGLALYAPNFAAVLWALSWIWRQHFQGVVDLHYLPYFCIFRPSNWFLGRQASCTFRKHVETTAELMCHMWDINWIYSQSVRSLLPWCPLKAPSQGGSLVPCSQSHPYYLSTCRVCCRLCVMALSV